MSDTPWSDLAPDGGRRVDSHGRRDFFWVRTPDGAPGLLLKLGPETAEVHPLPRLRNLTLSYRQLEGRSNLCLSLSDRAHVDIFETLCRDVVQAAEDAENDNTALDHALRRTMRWHHLLRGGSADGLTLEEQRGLVAELATLRDLSARFGPLEAISGWTGPLGSAKDFELSHFLLEVKARRGAAHSKVAISSEEQLRSVDCIRFFLRVLDVDTAIGTPGQNLGDHVAITAALFADDPAATDMWEQRLASTGYVAEEVDPRRIWRTGTTRLYRVSDGFPRVVPPLPEGVADLRYTISLAACAPFEVNDEALMPERMS